jgi:hypothetical protein
VSDGDDTQCQHQCLIAVVTRSPITGLKDFRQGKLGDLLAITKNTELRFAAHHFAASDQTGFAALNG